MDLVVFPVGCTPRLLAHNQNSSHPVLNLNKSTIMRSIENALADPQNTMEKKVAVVGVRISFGTGCDLASPPDP